MRQIPKLCRAKMIRHRKSTLVASATRVRTSPFISPYVIGPIFLVAAKNRVPETSEIP